MTVKVLTTLYCCTPRIEHGSWELNVANARTRLSTAGRIRCDLPTTPGSVGNPEVNAQNPPGGLPCGAKFVAVGQRAGRAMLDPTAEDGSLPRGSRGLDDARHVRFRTQLSGI